MILAVTLRLQICKVKACSTSTHLQDPITKKELQGYEFPHFTQPNFNLNSIVIENQ